jgi:hypothetical protein
MVLSCIAGGSVTELPVTSARDRAAAGDPLNMVPGTEIANRGRRGVEPTPNHDGDQNSLDGNPT